MHCPADGALLVRTRASGGIAYACERCSGRAVTMPVLRRHLTAGAARELWQRATAARSVAVDAPSCPACRMPMATVPVTTAERSSDHAAERAGEGDRTSEHAAERTVQLDVCRACHVVWFDPGEAEALPAAPEPPPFDDGLTVEERQRFAIEHVRAMARQARHDAEEEPSLELSRLPAILGLPVELHAGARDAAWATWTLAAAVVLTSAWAFAEPDVCTALQLVPNDVGDTLGVTLLTVFFVHGGWVHLLGNTYFLLVFGDDGERTLGWRRWLGLVAGATVLGSLLHVLGEPRSEIPCVGASGGISGLIVAYALLHPHARLGTFFGRGVHRRWVVFPAWVGLLVWAGLQLLLVARQLTGEGSVSGLAHVGGALTGVIAWWAWREPRAAHGG